MRNLLLILKIITGLTITSILKVHGTAACNVSLVDNRLQANCSNKNIVDVPQNLDEKIQLLDLSYNQITKINEQSFKRYKDLAVLLMRNMRLSVSANPQLAVSHTAFGDMEKLEHLDITGSYFSDTAQPTWPPYLRILNVNDNKIRFLELGHATDLEELYANDNELSEFPVLNPLAPMKIIEIENNPILFTNILNIAAFCQLQRFAVKFPDGQYVQSETFFCDCTRMNLWLTVNNIKWTNPLNCTVPKDPNSQDNICNSWFSEEEMAAFRACQTRITTRKIVTPFFLAAILGTVTGLIILTVCATLVYARRKARLESLRAEIAATAAEEIEEEEEETPE